MGKKNKMRNINTEELLHITDFTKIQTFLISAINDISGWIKFLDTKVSIIMAALGIIISATINCREIIYATCQMLRAYDLLYIFFCILILIFIITAVSVYFWGLQTIKSHRCNINFKSLWFILENKEDYPFKIYKENVKKMTETDVIDALAAELYKLNDIHRQKAATMKRIIRAFGTNLLILFIIMCICVGSWHFLGIVSLRQDQSCVPFPVSSMYRAYSTI